MSDINPGSTRPAPEVAALTQLAEASPVFRFEPAGVSSGDSIASFTFYFLGATLCLDQRSQPQFLTGVEQRCEVILPAGYPEQPPKARWLTSIWHPNVAPSGALRLEDIGLPWSPAAGMEVLAECLWDVARLAFVNQEQIANPAAWQWLQAHPEIVLPIDPRPLRGAYLISNNNIVKYSHRPRGRLQSGPREIFYIGEETALPATAATNSSSQMNAADTREIVFLEDN